MTAVLPISAEPAALPQEDAQPGRWRRMPAKAKAGAVMLGLFVLAGIIGPLVAVEHRVQFCVRAVESAGFLLDIVREGSAASLQLIVESADAFDAAVCDHFQNGIAVS